MMYTQTITNNYILSFERVSFQENKIYILTNNNGYLTIAFKQRKGVLK